MLSALLANRISNFVNARITLIRQQIDNAIRSTKVLESDAVAIT